MKRLPRNRFRAASIFFILVNAGAVLFRDKLESYGFDLILVIIGNLFLFFVSGFSFMLMVKGLAAKNNATFLRMFYSSFIFKFILVAIAAFIYIMYANKEVNKPGIFLCLGLYLIYTVIEVSVLLKVSKESTNA